MHIMRRSPPTTDVHRAQRECCWKWVPAFKHNRHSFCRHLQIISFVYLHDVIERVATHPAWLMLELTPREWKRRWQDSGQGRQPDRVTPQRVNHLSSVAESQEATAACGAAAYVIRIVSVSEPSYREEAA